MEPFRFRLARVLDWYGKRGRLEEDRLRLILANIVRVDDSIRRIRESRKEAERNLLQLSSLQAADLMALDGFRERSHREETAQQQARVRLEKSVEEQRARIKDLRTRIRLLEKLRERRLADHTVLVDRELEELAGDAFRAASFRSGREEVIQNH
jgi:flagellar export protein FliJ